MLYIVCSVVLCCVVCRAFASGRGKGGPRPRRSPSRGPRRGPRHGPRPCRVDQRKQTLDRHSDLCTDTTRLIGSSPPQQSHSGSSRSRPLGFDRKLLLHPCPGIIFSSSRPLALVPSQTSLLDYQIFPVAATAEQSPSLCDRPPSGCNGGPPVCRRNLLSAAPCSKRGCRSQEGWEGIWPLEEAINLLDYIYHRLWQIRLILATGRDHPHPGQEAAWAPGGTMYVAKGPSDQESHR